MLQVWQRICDGCCLACRVPRPVGVTAAWGGMHALKSCRHRPAARWHLLAADRRCRSCEPALVAPSTLGNVGTGTEAAHMALPPCAKGSATRAKHATPADMDDRLMSVTGVVCTAADGSMYMVNTRRVNHLETGGQRVWQARLSWPRRLGHRSPPGPLPHGGWQTPCPVARLHVADAPWPPRTTQAGAGHHPQAAAAGPGPGRGCGGSCGSGPPAGWRLIAMDCGGCPARAGAAACAPCRGGEGRQLRDMPTSCPGGGRRRRRRRCAMSRCALVECHMPALAPVPAGHHSAQHSLQQRHSRRSGQAGRGRRQGCGGHPKPQGQG